MNIEWIAAHSPQAKGRIERSFQTAQDRLVKGLRQVGAQDLETANQYLQQVYIPFWNRRFGRDPQLPGDAHRPVPRESNLDSVLSIRRSRTLDQDHTIRWDGVIYRMDPKQIARGTRGSRVQVERRLSGNLWMHWRTQILPLERCEAKALEPRVNPVRKPRAAPVRSPAERTRAQQRLLQGRRQWKENYKQLRNRVIWQAMKDPSLQTGELR